MNSAQIRVVKQLDQMRLGGLLHIKELETPKTGREKRYMQQGMQYKVLTGVSTREEQLHSRPSVVSEFLECLCSAAAPIRRHCTRMEINTLVMQVCSCRYMLEQLDTVDQLSWLLEHNMSHMYFDEG